MTTDTPDGTRILGSLRSAGGVGVVRIEDRFDARIAEVWSAITDPARLGEWHARVEGDLHPGGEFRIYVESDDWEGTGRVEACEPPHRLSVRTRESDESWRKGQGVPPFDEVVEVTLVADGGDQTVIVAEVAGIPLDVVAYYGVGWQLHIESLAAYLAGRERGDADSRFEELLTAYQALAAGLG
jgi:uncharacterized protein YndB with AHSA1/START domain